MEVKMEEPYNIRENDREINIGKNVHKSLYKKNDVEVKIGHIEKM